MNSMTQEGSNRYMKMEQVRIKFGGISRTAFWRLRRFPDFPSGVQLTPGQSFGFGEGDVVLNRDAAMGISEYAPAAEVIANGRIWRSSGLAYYPRMFMPTEYYVACPECHHVDIGVSREDVPSNCTN